MKWPRFVDCLDQDIASDNYCDIILLTNSLKNVAKLILYAFVEFLNILIICFIFKIFLLIYNNREFLFMLLNDFNHLIIISDHSQKNLYLMHVENKKETHAK